jgi:hypothetical protein
MNALYNKRMQSEKLLRRAPHKPLMRSVEAVGKPVDNLATINFGAESLLKILWQRFMTLIFTYRRIFLVDLCKIYTVCIFLQLRYVAIQI